jgi:dTDP-glucose 4,6-dehydratase
MNSKTYAFIQDEVTSLLGKNKINELSPLNGSTVCITGGAGFVGTWLTEIINYLNVNHNFKTQLFIFDRDIEKVKLNSPHLLKSKFIHYQRADTRYLVELPSEINYIIHASAFPDSRDHVSNPVDVMSTSAIGTEMVLKSAERLSNLKMFLNLSSSLVYGSFAGRSNTIGENDFSTFDFNSISSVYAEAKRYSESITSAFRSQFRIPTIILRPFSLVGPYQPLHGPWALNNFINDAICGNSIKILGDGETKRSFLYATDAAFWILKSVLHAQSGSIYNLGSPEGISLKELAILVQKNFNVYKELIFCVGSKSSHKTNSMLPNTTLIQSQLNLEITVPLSAAIEKTINWYLLSQKP